ncbi:putative transmembrane protein [Toxoplasma gondii GAB2-2007-GAL-DOM2]|uniref:Transmembrane protein n=5 Tax=Toxoplasma gondii TaxID=5811 RepID=S7WJF6_TOXGG|nr:hypothetical protein TGGT1_233695 [Toxoplasma gondii GT1]KAF4641946.1 hypothetical protein TGRH88_077580 [Toxoplasma gondii]KFG48913.1 putative transmembrane protein [Toxoplasma gondii GAB2-2007-GAL-DOM2]KFG55185.1 putative transmembrane protein [Toxoplasma gondii FOU]PUA92518.1 putative transmembrane protein [Toxoplasma gondii TgCATBr9]
MTISESLRGADRRAPSTVGCLYTAACSSQTDDCALSSVSASPHFASLSRLLRGCRSRKMVLFGLFACLACVILSLPSSPASPSVQVVSAASLFPGDSGLHSTCAFLSEEGRAPPRRLQAGVYFSEEDRARKGQIYLWVPLTLVGILILVVLYMLKIGNVFDPLLHTRFTPSDRNR